MVSLTLPLGLQSLAVLYSLVFCKRHVPIDPCLKSGAEPERLYLPSAYSVLGDVPALCARCYLFNLDPCGNRCCRTPPAPDHELAEGTEGSKVQPV